MLCVVSSTPRRFAYWWRMPPLASAVEPEQTVSRSSTTTGPTPRRARWYAVLTPMMPAPTIRTSAVFVMTPATILRLWKRRRRCDDRHRVHDLLAHRPLRAHRDVRHRDLDQRDGRRLALHSRGARRRGHRYPGEHEPTPRSSR